MFAFSVLPIIVGARLPNNSMILDEAAGSAQRNVPLDQYARRAAVYRVNTFRACRPAARHVHPHSLALEFNSASSFVEILRPLGSLAPPQRGRLTNPAGTALPLTSHQSLLLLTSHRQRPRDSFPRPQSAYRKGFAIPRKSPVFGQGSA
jgi:hypothetical protein